MLLKYDREELYQKVWERPMLKVAEEYGVSSETGPRRMPSRRSPRC